MRLTKRLRQALVRWDRLLLALVLVLPVILSAGLGFVWLYEHGWLLWFVGISVAAYAALHGALLVARWRGARAVDDMERDLRGPEPDPDWSADEVAAFDRARVRINTRLSAPIPWPDLPAEALAVVEEIATDMSGGKRSALDFTVPEALLLIDRVALQYRHFLLQHVPLSDRLSVRTMHWAWRKQDTALTAWETGFLAWRGVRLILNPAMGLLREAERVLASGLQDRLTDRFRRDAQAILLEEAAQAAIDLYSGRLRVSETEMMQIVARADQVPVAPADGPFSILLVGQKGAGKSTLINALLGYDAAEVDAAPVTGDLVAYDWSLDGAACRLIDTPGLDGGAKTTARLAAQMIAADLVIWVHRATRPGRAPDTALAAQFAALLVAEPHRHAPELVHVANGADMLVSGWPRPENQLSAADQSVIDAAVQAIGATMQATQVLPLRAEPPDWNIDVLKAAIAAVLPQARKTQRSRLRNIGTKATGVRGNAARAGRGAKTLAKTLVGRLRR